MIYITQLIYIQQGQEKVFDDFESIAIPTISKYNGQLLFRLRPPAGSYIEVSIEKPYEIHFVRFNTARDFENFLHDEERKRFLHLKERAIRETLLVKGEKL